MLSAWPPKGGVPAAGKDRLLSPEIASISGHKSLREVQRYIEEANQARLAQAAMRRLKGQNENTEVANLREESGYPPDKSKA